MLDSMFDRKFDWKFGPGKQTYRHSAVWCLLMLWLAGAAASAHAQAGSSSDLEPIGAPWHVQAGDNLQFAEAGFDDARWAALVPGAPLHLQPSAHDGYFWARLQLHAVRPTEHPALLLFPTGSLPFAVYVNGREVAESAGMEERVLRRARPMTVPLPPGGAWTVALRFFYPRVLPPRILPLSSVFLGPLGEAQLAADLRAVREFDTLHLSEVIGTAMCCGLCLFAAGLYAMQRRQAEYLWLALFCGFYGACGAFKVAMESSALPEGTALLLLYRYLGCCSMVASLEFVMRFAGSQRRTAAYVLEGLFLLLPLVGLWSEPGFVICLAVCLLALFGFIGVYLWNAHRRGITEVQLLVPFLGLLVLVNAYYFVAVLYPAHVRFPPRMHFGTLGVGLEDLTILFFLAGVLALVLYRFHRITREEQRNAAELDAARTVQQVLIPEQLPKVPGFHFDSVYQPARQVGGDFLQVLPTGDGGALVALGDVSGKGLEAAMTVAVIVGALRTLVEATESPQELIAGLNRRLLHHGTGFTTCAIVRLHADGRGELCSAGHLPPYLDGTALEGEPGLPLGLAAEAPYSSVLFQLGPGQRLTLVTDGVVEAKSAAGRELFGFERTLAVSTRSAREIAQAALQFAGGAEQADDITVLTVSLDPDRAAKRYSPASEEALFSPAHGYGVAAAQVRGR